ncbi:hypothetical protein NHQ30_002974 [Ciborinia camelliae]|nr:hypothetical protein NHQ30_002974 [Ciborinia camelliae]
MSYQVGEIPQPEEDLSGAARTIASSASHPENKAQESARFEPTSEEPDEDKDVHAILPSLIRGHSSPSIPPVARSDISSPSPTSQSDRRVIFHFIRHAEAYHNIGIWGITDPGLTANGKRQCEQLRTILPAESNISLILCSSMTRTIETTLIAFKDVMETGNVKTVAWSALREWGRTTSSTGSPLPELKEKYGQQIGFELVHEPDWELLSEGPLDKSRAQTVKNHLFTLAKIAQEKTRSGELVTSGDEPYEIAVVSHSGFLEAMLKTELGPSRANRNRRERFWNANMKSFSFDTIDGPCGVRYELTQTKESKKRPFSSGPF